MSQEEILELFAKHPNKWWKIIEIANKLKISPGSVTHSMKGLRKGNSVNYKNKDNYSLELIYKHKRGKK